jgi:hypothetical protein
MSFTALKQPKFSQRNFCQRNFVLVLYKDRICIPRLFIDYLANYALNFTIFHIIFYLFFREDFFD